MYRMRQSPEHLRRLRGSGRLLALLICGFVLLAGCNNPDVKRAQRHRSESLAFAANALTWREGTTERLERDVAWIGDDFQQHNEWFARDVRGGVRRLEFDIQRFREQQDEYRRYLADTLDGKPENLSRTGIVLLY